MVRSVPVQEHGDAVPCGPQARQARPTVSSARFGYDLGACGQSDLGGPIAGAVVDDDDPISGIEVLAQGRDELTDGWLLVQARDDRPEVARRRWSAHSYR